MRAHRSYSQLSSYLHCQWSYYLTKVAKKEEQPSVWLAGGRAFHSTTEHFDETVGNDTELIAANAGSELLEAWADKFTVEFELALDELRETHPDESTWRTAGRATKDKPHGEDVLWWHTAGRQFVTDYIKWRAANADVWELAIVPATGELAIEVEVSIALGEQPMRGWADRVFRARDDGRLAVFDMKSGSRIPAGPVQLATYSVQLEAVFDEPVLWGYFYDARKGTITPPINLSKWTNGNLGYLYETLDFAIENNVFLPTLDSHCGKCGVNKFCKWYGGREDAG